MFYCVATMKEANSALLANPILLKWSKNPDSTPWAKASVIVKGLADPRFCRPSGFLLGRCNHVRFHTSRQFSHWQLCGSVKRGEHLDEFCCHPLAD